VSGWLVVTQTHLYNTDYAFTVEPPPHAGQCSGPTVHCQRRTCHNRNLDTSLCMYRVAQKRNINKSYCRGVRKYVVAAAVLMSSSSWGGVFPGCCITLYDSNA